MMRRLLRVPLAMIIRIIMTRPRLKLAARRMLMRWPLLAGLARRLTHQSSFQPPLRRTRAHGAAQIMTVRSSRIYHALRKERNTPRD